MQIISQKYLLEEAKKVDLSKSKVALSVANPGAKESNGPGEPKDFKVFDFQYYENEID